MKKLLLILLLSKMAFGPSGMIDINAIKKQNLEKQKQTELLNAEKQEEIKFNYLIEKLIEAFAGLLEYDLVRSDKNKEIFSVFKRRIHSFLLGTIELDAKSIQVLKEKYGIEWSKNSEGSVCLETTFKNDKGDIIDNQISCFLKAQLAEKI